MKKIGLICMALVLALGALGVGFAMWSDTITIDGTVNTGNVDIVVTDWSNTWVWKVVGNPDYPNEIAVMHQWESDPNNELPPDGMVPVGPGPGGKVAYADSDRLGDDRVGVYFGNLFPSVDFIADFLVHCAGSIPVRVQLTNITCDNPLINDNMTVAYYLSNAAGDLIDYDPSTPDIIDPIPGLEGMQLHYCEWLIVMITIHLPQNDALMLQTGTITGTIQVVQWNEYVGP